MEQPYLRVVRGDASPEEIAALVAVLSARAAARPAGRTAEHRSAWSDRSRMLRTPLPRGPGAWRASAFPR